MFVIDVEQIKLRCPETPGKVIGKCVQKNNI